MTFHPEPIPAPNGSPAAAVSGNPGAFQVDQSPKLPSLIAPLAIGDDETDAQSYHDSLQPISDRDHPSGAVDKPSTDILKESCGETQSRTNLQRSETTGDLSHVGSSLASPQSDLSHANMSKISLQGAGRSIIRELTVEEELMSLKVRSLYDSRVNAPSLLGSVPSGSVRAGLENNRLSAISATSNRSFRLQTGPSSGRNSTANSAISMNIDQTGRESDSRAEFELAGGAEDWEDVDADDIDRYGFIMPKPSAQPFDTTKANTSSKTGRKRASASLSLKTNAARNHIRPIFARSRHLNVLISPFRIKKQPEMLTSPIAGSNERMKSKEVERVAKWHNMASKLGTQPTEATTGARTHFHFQTSDPKLVDRTWKGIPDCWRAAAWSSFLETSAKRQLDHKTNECLIEYYHELLNQNSPDDVQIDLDVPRTISSHIMFRRRYRGGQRLLFRVLHAISLYFPDIGYVQGMASLAATFLCYYDEDAAFVMLVRLFELRGLHTLYSNGFGGLMDALHELDTEWLQPSHPQISQKLESLGISVLSFGTRWYLTLFNYSVPFAAQLRIWDVFLLLGDDEGVSNLGSTGGFGGSLDVLHATSTALVGGMQDVVLGSDFEGSMKCLTSWIPIKDEDVLMRNVKAEWKKRKRRKFVERLPRALVSGGNRPGTANPGIIDSTTIDILVASSSGGDAWHQPALSQLRGGATATPNVGELGNLCGRPKRSRRGRARACTYHGLAIASPGRCIVSWSAVCGSVGMPVRRRAGVRLERGGLPLGVASRLERATNNLARSPNPAANPAPGRAAREIFILVFVSVVAVASISISIAIAIAIATLIGPVLVSLV
ncbi:hypothetical protein Dda_8014 [Drechslerella dactyloides]|uniref:Rab-GAP TBC domain-containing protein n=1 Tax=Drechslerella dactyloides TaxID=74499 RepID=A0AAD6IRD5_DREDA|nr:hypothetical protein Dda_8014 [Drechslerella dactyloides]